MSANHSSALWWLAAACFLSLFRCAAASGQLVYPESEWMRKQPAELGLNPNDLAIARDYALSAGGSGKISRSGVEVMRWGDQQRKYDLKSTSKSIGVTALGLAIDDGKIGLDDLAALHQPDFGIPPQENLRTGWIEQISIRHLASQSAGFEKPGGYGRLLFRPGSRWHYSDGGPNWLAECVTLAMGKDIQSLMFERVLSPIGITSDDLHWRKHQYRPAKIGSLRRCEFGSGVHANVDAMARIGLLYLRRGKWNGKQILSESFVESVSRPEPKITGLDEWEDDHGNASRHYGLLWWNNGDGAIEGVPNDAFWSWGLHDSLIVVIPSLDIVVSRTGKSWRRDDGQQHYDVLAPFLKPICSAAQSTGSTRVDTDGSTSDLMNRARAPYPSSELGQIRWDPVASVQRFAKGSDNWPITWMDDDSMLTAYGDGWGFEPRTKQKLSLGFAIIRGTTDDLSCENLRSPSGERLGQGRHGIKASGLLMVDGVVYLLARNAGNATVAWSADRGKTWTWSDWSFRVSFGCPSFVNFGPDYRGSIDDWVYMVSPDSDSAYAASDQMVMARVAKGEIRSAEAYMFFAGLNSVGTPTWSDDVSDRAPIFVNPNGCYRGAMTYSEGLKRFLWCQVLYQSPHPQGPRFAGGFGAYDAPNPWGPWTTLFHTQRWDMGPGESSSFPTKWMSADGKRLHLLFSGDDAFSVRGAHILHTADGTDGADGS